jgi:hypothetical protein
MFRASTRHFETHSVSGRCPLVQIASRPLASVVSIDAALASPPHGPGSHVDVRAKIAHWLGATNANVAHSDEHGRIASALRMEWIASRAASGITSTVDCPTDDGKGVVDMADAELTFTLLPKAVRESLMEPVRAACLRVEDGLCGTLGPRSVATDAWLDEAASAAHAPPLLPPLVARTSHGDGVVPNSGLKVCEPAANSGVFVFPTTTAPLSSTARTIGPEYVATCVAKCGEPRVHSTPSTAFVSLIRIGRPRSGGRQRKPFTGSRDRARSKQ